MTLKASAVPLALLTLGAAALWLSWSAREPALDARTRDRLR